VRVGHTGSVRAEQSPAVRAEELVERRALVVDVVLDLLTSRGYDAVVVREVSRRSGMSSKTIYKLFETREHMIVAGLERWMVTNVYVKVVLPEPDESLYDVLMRFLRALFEPWEQNPRMLEAYHRAQLGPAGARLRLQGTTAARRVGQALLIDDVELAQDLEEIMRNVSEGLISRFVHGELEVGDIVPRLEVAAARLTGTHTRNELERDA
jgi:TetR/AcrR family transcriptional regulator, cholesterol catabolism regulator